MGILNKKRGKGGSVTSSTTQSNNTPNPSTPINKTNTINPTNKGKKLSKRRELLDMYDMILANLLAKKSIIEPQQPLGQDQIQIGFQNISSETQLTKYMVVYRFPDYIQNSLIDYIRKNCINDGVKINFYFYSEPYHINWDSPEMKNKMNIWKNYTESTNFDLNAFNYRAKRQEVLARERILKSTMYLNKCELEYRRQMMRVAIILEISAVRSDQGIINMTETVQQIYKTCSILDLKVRELQINMVDWIKAIGPFQMETKSKEARDIPKKVLTDDILANFGAYKQGRVGETGVQLGMDVGSGGPILRKFKENPDKAENWLICAETGGGKSYFIKSLLMYLLADGFVVTVMDYEGDEYTNIAKYLAAGNPEDVKVVQMGNGSTTYFDPCEIPMLTGDPDIDQFLKADAINYISQVFRVITCGLHDNFSKPEERIVSTAIQRMYDSARVTDDPSTWTNSQGLRLRMVYDEIKVMVDTKEFYDSDNGNIKHKAAMRIREAASIYFEPGESRYGTFENPMSANELYKAKFIVFSFGMRGAASSLIDPTILALKQLSVANIQIQISNYCKYIRHCFNVKVWEEYQRWGDTDGAGDIIGNVMTGGRKRGDVNFIITNDLASMLDQENRLNKKLAQNIQNYAIGFIPSKDVRHEFCRQYSLQECEGALELIAKQSNGKLNANSKKGSRYKHAFCIVMDDGKKAIGKVELPDAISNQKLFRGMVVDGGK